METREAVKRYEKMVAPSNYKRPTALITQGMIDKAVETIRELDLEVGAAASSRSAGRHLDQRRALVRCFGAGEMRDGLRDMLSSAVKPSKKAPQFADEMTGEQFIRDVLPSSDDTVEIFFDNALRPT
jgi:sugar-specific transcriptional regulator TrmB